MKYRTYSIGNKTYSEDEMQKILSVKENIMNLQSVQDSLFRSLEAELATTRTDDHLFDFVFNDFGSELNSVKVNLIDTDE